MIKGLMYGPFLITTFMELLIVFAVIFGFIGNRTEPANMTKLAQMVVISAGCMAVLLYLLLPTP